MNSISVGSVDGAYFVPRGELLQWVNTTCQMNLIKIEDLCTGIYNANFSMNTWQENSNVKGELEC